MIYEPDILCRSYFFETTFFAVSAKIGKCLKYDGAVFINKDALFKYQTQRFTEH